MGYPEKVNEKKNKMFYSDKITFLYFFISKIF